MVVVNPIFNSLKVVPAREGESFSVPLNITGAVIRHGGILTEEEKAYASSIFPIQEWGTVYSPFFIVFFLAEFLWCEMALGKGGKKF